MAAKKKKKATKKVAKKKATTKKATTKKSAAKEMLIVGSKAKDALRAHGCNVSSDALEGVNGWVHWLIAQAANRAQANGRKTVRAPPKPRSAPC